MHFPAAETVPHWPPPGSALEVDAIPAIEAIAAAVTAPPIAALFVRTVGCARGEKITLILEIDGVPDTSIKRVVECAIGQHQLSVEALNDGGLVCEFPSTLPQGFETHRPTSVSQSLVHRLSHKRPHIHRVHTPGLRIEAHTRLVTQTVLGSA